MLTAPTACTPTRAGRRANRSPPGSPGERRWAREVAAEPEPRFLAFLIDLTSSRTLLADRPTTSRRTPRWANAPSGQADPRRHEPRPTLRQQDTLTGVNRFLSQTSDSAFDPTGTVAGMRPPKPTPGSLRSLRRPQAGRSPRRRTASSPDTCVWRGARLSGRPEPRPASTFARVSAIARTLPQLAEAAVARRRSRAAAIRPIRAVGGSSKQRLLLQREKGAVSSRPSRPVLKIVPADRLRAIDSSRSAPAATASVSPPAFRETSGLSVDPSVLAGWTPCDGRRSRRQLHDEGRAVAGSPGWTGARPLLADRDVHELAEVVELDHDLGVAHWLYVDELGV